MTAFVIEALLLIAAAFGIGICLGWMLHRRHRVRAGRRSPAGAAAPATAGTVTPPAEPAPVPAAEVMMADALPAAAIEIAPAERELLVAHNDAADAQAPTGARDQELPGVRPRAEAPAPGAAADDLKRLKGIGPLNERRLHELGIHHFRQIADWTPAEVEWVGSYLAFPGRIEREDWVGQARALLAGTSAEALPAPRKSSR